MVVGEASHLQVWEYQTGVAEEGPFQMAAGEACSRDRLQAWEHQNLGTEGHLHDGSYLCLPSSGLEYQMVLAGQSWYQTVVAGEDWCQMVVVGEGCYHSVGGHLEEAVG